MHWFSVGVAVLSAVAIIGIGSFYLVTPMAMSRSFGLPTPGESPNVAWWLRLKGTRDVASGLVLLAVLGLGDVRTLGVVLLILTLIPLGDMIAVLSAKGSTKTAFGMHGLTAAIMVLGAMPLVTGFK